MNATRRPSNRLPALLFTCGDPAGIGPELAVAAALSSRVRRACVPILVGELAVFRRAGWKPGLAPLVDTRLGLTPPAKGRSSAVGGKLSFASFRLAVRLAARGVAAGVVSAPISKKSWAMAGLPYPDHTEYLRELCPRADAQMILGAPSQGLWCVLATRHIPTAKVAKLLSVDSIVSSAVTLRRALILIGRKNPTLGLCAFNPHAGEDGLLGPEEARILAPAAKRAGLQGPIAADTAWRWHTEGKLDGLVCLYHDQALIPLKTAAGLGIVNWTAGLPFIRTSPGHGTGFDIAGKRKADPSATIEAALLAASLAA